MTRPGADGGLNLFLTHNDKSVMQGKKEMGNFKKGGKKKMTKRLRQLQCLQKRKPLERRVGVLHQITFNVT